MVALCAAPEVGFPSKTGELLVGVAQLDAKNDRFPFFRAQSRQGVLVTLDLFHADRPLERRTCLVDLGPLQLSVRRSSPHAANLVADAVHHRLAEVGLQGPLALGFEHINSVKRLEQGFLDKILRVGEVARPARQPPPGPALQPGKVPFEEPFERLPVAGAKALDEMKRGFGVVGGRRWRAMPAVRVGGFLRSAPASSGEDSSAAIEADAARPGLAGSPGREPAASCPEMPAGSLLPPEKTP